MGKRIEYPIGEVFERKKGKKYEVVGTDGTCAAIDRICAFFNKPKACEDNECHAIYRKDHEHVCFIRRKDLEQPKETP